MPRTRAGGFALQRIVALCKPRADFDVCVVHTQYRDEGQVLASTLRRGVLGDGVAGVMLLLTREKKRLAETRAVFAKSRYFFAKHSDFVLRRTEKS